ncbi:uncharacterized protein LOC122505055 [Leptopilina heterotoma]|uniref:uncharacterized protein LOC122505055 n=1 Tax=Leptopilina heterotoma TaxID=63436 RepID=UPI001CA7CCC6|nr:uncharacterized protein LOC122505055 [Leptopilina heterotoma]
MNKIALGNIITIIFSLTIQIAVSTRILPTERLEMANDFYDRKLLAIDNHINYPFKYEAWVMLENHVLSVHKLDYFLQEINKTGKPIEFFHDMKLINPIHFKVLRYFTFMESNYFDINDAGDCFKNLNSNVFNNSFEISFQHLFYSYVRMKLNELLSFEDYYALRIFLQDYSQINLENPLGWRIRRAIFNLAIRQYKERPQLSSDSDVAELCTFYLIKSEKFICDIKKNDVIRVKEFQVCSGGNQKYESLIKEITPFTYLVSYDVNILNNIQIVNLNEITESNEDLYVILPDTKLILSKKLNPVRRSGIILQRLIQNVYVLNINDQKLLTNWANKVENLQTLEKEYLEYHSRNH